MTDSQLTFKPNPPTINSEIHFELNFAIPEAVRVEMVPGDYYEMDMPSGLAIEAPSPEGNLTDSDGTIYGTYKFDVATQKIRITFTKQADQDFLPPEGGSVDADVHFDTQKITQPGTTTIIYPSKTNLPPYTVTIKPTSGTSISKAGHTDKANNPNKVTWEVDFNKDYATLDQPVVTEKFPQQVTFNKNETGAVTVYPLTVDFNGNVTGTGTTPLDPSSYTVQDDGSIKFNTTINRPYRIVYATTIKDEVKPTDGGTIPITNNVTLTAGNVSLDASATVQLNYKKALEKVRTGYDSLNQIYSWQIRYNYGQKELANDTVISDTYTNMTIDPASFSVYTVNFDSNGNAVKGSVIDPADYEIDTTTNPFTIRFKNNVQAGKAINIDYKSKVNKIVSGSANNQVQVTNTAKTNHLPPTTTITERPSQQVVIKNKPTVDPGSKMANYVIDINKNKYEMDNAVFTDTMDHTENGYVSVPFKVKNPTNEDAGVLIRDVNDNKILTGSLILLNPDGTNRGIIGNPETADYVVRLNVNESGRGYKNFTVTFQNGYAKTSHQFQMSYYVNYNQFSDEKPNPDTTLKYGNTMKVNFVNNDVPYDSSSSKDFTTSTQEANQGMKSGSYNPVTKEITWTIVTNYNNLGVSVFNLKDPITGNQSYVKDSLNVTRGTINGSGNFVATTDADYSGNQVGKSYLTVTEPTVSGEDDQGTLELQFGRQGEFIPGWDASNSPKVYQIQFKTSLKGKIVYDQATYANTATVQIAGVDQQLSASVSIAFGGQSALKNGSYDANTNQINWSLVINPNQSLLSNVKVTDTPSANQILKENFKLYTGKYSGSGNATTVQPDQEVPSDQYTVKVTTDPATGQQSFVVDLSKIEEKDDSNGDLTGVIEKPYVLTYASEPNFTSQTENVTNNATISSEGKELPGKDTQRTILVRIQDSSGTAYGTKGKVIVQKVNGKDEVVPGAVLQLVRKNTQTNQSVVLYQTTTDSQGMTTFGNLIATSSLYEYYVKEIEAPDGYTIPDELLNGKRVTVNTNNSTEITEIENQPVKVVFEKTNGNGQALAGGLFTLFRNTGTKENPNYAIVRSFTPTTNGMDLSGLADGQYRIQEVVAPTGYQINQTLINFEIKKNDNNSRSVYVNDQAVANGVLQLRDYQGSAVLKKTNESGTALSGAHFQLQRAELNSEDYSDYGDQSIYVTDRDGLLNLKNLAPGKYKLKESQAPDGYYLNSTEFSFAIQPVSKGDQAPETIELNAGENFINYKGNARFMKVDGHAFNQGGTVALAGAKFQLYDASGTNKIGEEVTSGEDGYFTFENLDPSTTYSFKETKAAPGYIQNEQVARFTTPATNQSDTAVTINSADQKQVIDEQTPYKNYKEGAQFQKVDEEGHGLPGAKYQLEIKKDDKWTAITDKVHGAGDDGLFTSDTLDGTVHATELSPGDYRFIEKTAPTGYVLNTKVIGFEIDDAEESDPGVLNIEIADDQNVNYQGSAQLYKEAESESDDSFNALAGASFDVYTKDNQKVTTDSIESDADGKVTATGLAPGDYYFKEVATKDDHYLVNETTVPFTIPTEAEGKPTVVTSNEDGKLSLKNYLGSLELKKVGPDDQALAGATFTIYDSEGNEAGTGTSNADGLVRIDKLSPGKYTIKETEAPTGYLINTQTVTFEIANSAAGEPKAQVIKAPFKDYKGAVKLVKNDASGNPLAGAEFVLLNSAGDEVRDGEIQRSNTYGEVVFKDLAPDTYTFKEIKAPTGYIKNLDTVSVTVPDRFEGDPEVISASQELINYQGSAELTKTDDQGNPLAGAAFKVIDADGKDVAGKTALSDENGLVRVTGLAPGDYRFVETDSPNKAGTTGNYILSGKELAFTVPAEKAGDPGVKKIEGDVQNYRGKILLHKVGPSIEDDDQVVGLEGAEFTLYTKADFSDQQPVKVVSDQTGMVEFDDLAPGTYYVKETAAPKGYLVNTFPVKVVIPERAPEVLENSTADSTYTDEEGYLNTIEDGQYIVDTGDFQNGRKEIDFKKTDGEPNGDLDVTKTEFALYYDDGSTDGKLVKEHLSPQSDGTIDLSNLALENGSYKLIETKTADNYLLNSQPVYFVVENNQAIGVSVDMKNYQGFIEATKVSGDKKLAGAEFKLYRADDLADPITTTDEAGKTQTVITSGTNGKLFARGLSAGDYVLKEVKAPTGYVLDTTAHKFTVTPQPGKVTAIQLGTLENYQGNVELTKVDSADVNKTLAGATFQLLDNDQKVIQAALTTNAKGQLTVTGLAPGRYTFKEIKAPTGYQLAPKTISLTIASSHQGKPETVKVIAKNTKTPPTNSGGSHKWYYPKTGEEKARFLSIIGGVIIIVVIGLIVWRKRRK